MITAANSLKIVYLYVALSACVICAGIVSAAAAQDAPPKSCFQAPALMSEGDISSFLAAPGELLNSNPVGGVAMTGRVRSLAGSSIDAVGALLHLASVANVEQKAAIGAGLARAVTSCVTVSPLYTVQVQEKVLAAQMPEVLTAFVAVSNDVQTASLGQGGTSSSSASGIAGGGIAGPGAAGSGGDESNPTAKIGNYSFGGGGRFFRTTAESVSGS